MIRPILRTFFASFSGQKSHCFRFLGVCDDALGRSYGRWVLVGISGDIYSGQGRQTAQHQAIMRYWGVKRDHDCGRAEMGFVEDCTLFLHF